MNVIFAHGFEGRTTGKKPKHMRRAYDWNVQAVQMSRLGWTIRNETQALLDAVDATEDFDLLVGSSMGGLAAANVSQLRPERKMKIVLLAPAFGLHQVWSGRPDVDLGEWERTNNHAYRGFSLKVDLEWQFMVDAMEMSWPKLNHPTVIIHGIHDDIIPIANSHRVRSENESVLELIETDDEHRLHGSLDRIMDAWKLLEKI